MYKEGLFSGAQMRGCLRGLLNSTLCPRPAFLGRCVSPSVPTPQSVTSPLPVPVTLGLPSRDGWLGSPATAPGARASNPITHRCRETSAVRPTLPARSGRGPGEASGTQAYCRSTGAWTYFK